MLDKHLACVNVRAFAPVDTGYVHGSLALAEVLYGVARAVRARSLSLRQGRFGDNR